MQFFAFRQKCAGSALLCVRLVNNMQGFVWRQLELCVFHAAASAVAFFVAFVRIKGCPSSPCVILRLAEESLCLRQTARNVSQRGSLANPFGTPRFCRWIKQRINYRAHYAVDAKWKTAFFAHPRMHNFAVIYNRLAL